MRTLLFRAALAIPPAFVPLAARAQCTVRVDAPAAGSDVPQALTVRGAAPGAVNVSVRYRRLDGRASGYAQATGVSPFSYTFSKLPEDAAELIVRGSSPDGDCWSTVPLGEVVNAARLSALFGLRGENWDTARLPDFSRAGYRESDALTDTSDGLPRSVGAGVTLKLPAPTAYATPAAFAVALQSAIDATSADGSPRYNAIELGRGRYLLDRVIHVQRSELVLRGAGRGLTTLAITKNLSELTPQNRDAQGEVLSCDELRARSADPALPADEKPIWYYSRGGFLEFNQRAVVSRTLAYVTADSQRGSSQLVTSAVYPTRPELMVSAGSRITLRAAESFTGTDADWLYDELLMGRVADLSAFTDRDSRLEWTVGVASVAGPRVTLERPMRWSLPAATADDGRPALSLVRIDSAIHDVGVESMDIEFVTDLPHPSHHCEPGYNAIDFNADVYDAWVKDVAFRNADDGVLVGYRSSRITLRGLRFSSTRAPNTELPGRQRYGHHGIIFNKAHDSYVTDVHFEQDMIHDIGVGHLASGNVFAQVSMTPASAAGVLATLDLDHHANAPTENLFTDIASLTSFQDSGNVSWGPASGARGVFWNIGASVGGVKAHYEAPPWGSIQTTWYGDLRREPGVAGSPLRVTPVRSALGAYYEHVDSPYPRDLFRAQLRLRRGEPPRD